MHHQPPRAPLAIPSGPPYMERNVFPFTPISAGGDSNSKPFLPPGAYHDHLIHSAGGHHLTDSMYGEASASRPASRENSDVIDGGDEIFDVDGEDDDDDRQEEEEGSAEAVGDSKSRAPRKRPRITLARGGACTNCRSRKLKCSGEKPCRTCQKQNLECRYEEVKPKKSRAVLLEERVVELEGILIARGETLPLSQLEGAAMTSLSPTKISPSAFKRGSTSSGASTKILTPPIGNQPPPVSHLVHPPNFASVNPAPDILPGSPLELALITFILPYTPFLLMPIHPQRFLALLGLPPNDPQRPHPALMYILFSEAVRALENRIPPPQMPRPPPALFPHNYSPTMPVPLSDPGALLQHVRGTSRSLLERARTELDKGIRNVDRPFDLVRASIGIARHLYMLGHFIEGWSIPVSRLMISCGLHRQTGYFHPPDGSPDTAEAMPKPYAPAHTYFHCHSQIEVERSPSTPIPLPVIRMRPVIIPPARDDIELAERNAVFWAGKMQDWEAGTGWSWTLSMADEECTTEWGWDWGIPEVKPPNLDGSRFGIGDLYDPNSMLHSSPVSDPTPVLAAKSMALLHAASHLFDLPESSSSVPHPSGRLLPTHIAPLPRIQRVETAIRLFRKRIPPSFSDPPLNTPDPRLSYDAPADPWWIMLHANLYTAEMLMYREMAHYQRQAYETAVSCARALVELVRRLRPESWVHADMIIALDISVASRFLYKESDRLSSAGEHHAAQMAADEAEFLRQALATDYSPWMHMASLHALIVQRVREGWPEKEGEYERI